MMDREFLAMWGLARTNYIDFERSESRRRQFTAARIASGLRGSYHRSENCERRE
jgi:hypothetical protein